MCSLIGTVCGKVAVYWIIWRLLSIAMAYDQKQQRRLGVYNDLLVTVTQNRKQLHPSTPVRGVITGKWLSPKGHNGDAPLRTTVDDIEQPIYLKNCNSVDDSRAALFLTGSAKHDVTLTSFTADLSGSLKIPSVRITKLMKEGDDI